ncbi:hypothetical protein BDR22DRAFT_816823 [Usnea florida]
MYTLNLARTLLLALSASTLATAGYSNTSTVAGTNMNITVFVDPNCNSNVTAGSALLVMEYGSQTAIGNATFQSYMLSRDTTLQEQLDISGPTKGMGVLDGNPQECTLFHETTSPDSNGHTLAGNKCYGLLNGPAQGGLVSGAFSY